jgi:uncharacterized Ntn-hydrolase superfamily protein
VWDDESDWRAMTYSIIARDRQTGHMGIATQTQALAVGSSVPWALPGYGVIATQSMGEPMYGELGLDALRGGLTAPEALTAMRSVDPHPDRRQVAMLDGHGNIDVYTGSSCVAAAGHRIGEGCASLANMVASPAVWESMVDAYEAASGSMPARLLAALHAAQDAGGDFRGQRSAAIVVVRAERTGRPWRDQIIDLRIDDHPEPVAELDRLVTRSERYHRAVSAFEHALDDEPDAALAVLAELGDPDPTADPDMALWSAIAYALADRAEPAASLLDALAGCAPAFIEAIYRFREVDLLPPSAVLDGVLPPRP